MHRCIFFSNSRSWITFFQYIVTLLALCSKFLLHCNFGGKNQPIRNDIISVSRKKKKKKKMNPWIITSSTWFTIEYHFTVHCTLLLFCYDKKLLRTPWNCHVHKGHKSWQSGNELVNMEFTFFANCRKCRKGRCVYEQDNG